MHNRATITGRFSSKEPNYSNVPKSLDFSESVADEGGPHMLLRRKGESARHYYNRVPAWLVDFRFTFREGELWSYQFKKPLHVYLDVMKEMQSPGARGAIQLLSPKRGWIFDADLKRIMPSSYGWRIT